MPPGPATAKPEPIVSSLWRLATLVGHIVLLYGQALLGLLLGPRRKSLRGHNVLITGSGHGLGRELALKFAQAGANLALVDINAANNQLVRKQVLNQAAKRPGPLPKVVALEVDIRDERKVADMAALVQTQLGPIDILVNNAGIVQCKPILELEPQMVERTFQVNTFAHLWTIRHFLPGMLERQRGHIVAISSIAGLIGNSYLADYCASKFAVVGLMDALDKELHSGGANPGLHLTTVCPTCMSTGMFQSFTSRFSWLLPVLDAEAVAGSVLDAVQANKSLVAVPAITLFLHRLSRVNQKVQDYLEYGVRPHAA